MFRNCRRGWVWLTLTLVVAASAPVWAQEKLTMWGLPPKEKPQFTKSAEGFPPLPLPAVPLRRSEKKRPPAPPMLLANLTNFSFTGWQGSPGAVDTLMQSGRKQLDVWYGTEQLDIRTLAREFAAGIDHRTPILYLCAYYPLDLTKDTREALVSYTTNGGTLVINCCGQDKSYASAKTELAAMFPHCPLRLLPADHPIYHSYYDIEKVRYPVPSTSALDAGAERVGPPNLEAVTLGARAAAIVSYEDLACGWNQWNNPACKRVSTVDSTRLGLNLITYVTAELRLAKFQAKTQDVAGPAIRPREQLAFAQLVHDGNWNPNPSAVPLFLKELAANTSIAVKFERDRIQLKDPSLFNYPLLYMTGQWNPNFSKEEVAILHRYLTSGGILVCDAAAGRVEFDLAFRDLVKQLFPEAALQTLPANHPLYSAFHKIDMLTANHEEKPIKPVVEAVYLGDKPVILYSKLGLSDGWAHLHDVYARCYATPDAIKLGTNMVVYAMQ